MRNETLTAAKAGIKPADFDTDVSASMPFTDMFEGQSENDAYRKSLKGLCIEPGYEVHGQ